MDLFLWCNIWYVFVNSWGVFVGFSHKCYYTQISQKLNLSFGYFVTNLQKIKNTKQTFQFNKPLQC